MYAVMITMACSDWMFAKPGSDGMYYTESRQCRMHCASAAGRQRMPGMYGHSHIRAGQCN
jgi:hypothetical protein